MIFNTAGLLQEMSICRDICIYTLGLQPLAFACSMGKLETLAFSTRAEPSDAMYLHSNSTGIPVMPMWLIRV